MDTAIIASGSIVLVFLVARGFAEVVSLIEQW